MTARSKYFNYVNDICWISYINKDSDCDNGWLQDFRKLKQQKQRMTILKVMCRKY